MHAITKAHAEDAEPELTFTTEITWPKNHGAPTREALLLTELDDTDRALLRSLQSGISLNQRPFKEIGERAGLSENEAIERIQKLLDKGIIRKIGAIIAPRELDYVSTLAAINAPESEVETIAELINGYKGVTHNYLREGEPNIWFTMTEPDIETMEHNIGKIEKATGLAVRRMPVEKLYKIGVKFDI